MTTLKKPLNVAGQRAVNSRQIWLISEQNYKLPNGTTIKKGGCLGRVTRAKWEKMITPKQVLLRRNDETGLISFIPVCK